MRLKKIISTLLVAVSLLSLSIPVSAEYTGDGGGSSGGSDSVSYGSYDSCQQGYRVTIVDEKGNPVTIPVDFR